MVEKPDRPGAREWVPPAGDVDELRRAAPDCRGCELWRDATQVVFSKGRSGATLMLVGEQPGDREDREGRPFVGPAGRELDRALEEAGIERADAYLTNMVKHFKFEERGKRRVHQTPKRFEIDACRPWLDEELRVVAPEALVLLGATAAKGVMGSSFRLTRHRGERLDCDLAPVVTATIHPSAILRSRDEASRRAERRALAEDLEMAVRALTS